MLDGQVLVGVLVLDGQVLANNLVQWSVQSCLLREVKTMSVMCWSPHTYTYTRRAEYTSTYRLLDTSSHEDIC